MDLFSSRLLVARIWLSKTKLFLTWRFHLLLGERGPISKTTHLSKDNVVFFLVCLDC